jgi:hypothetical protein
MKIAPIDASRFRADFELVGPDGRLHLRLTGWEDRSFPLPEAFWGIRAGVPDRAFTTEWPVPVSGVAGTDAYCGRRADGFDPELVLGSGRIWLEVLARQVLSRRERAEWRSLGMPDARRLAWLLRRVAAKDAVRFLLRRRHGLELCPADVELEPGPDGRPVAGGEWSGRVSPPALSITDEDGVPVAVAGDAAVDLPAAIDLEPNLGGSRLTTSPGGGDVVELSTGSGSRES